MKYIAIKIFQLLLISIFISIVLFAIYIGQNYITQEGSIIPLVMSFLIAEMGVVAIFIDSFNKQNNGTN